MDHLLDFKKAEDKIAVTNIDANTGSTGNQNFVLDANSSFSVGEIRQRVDGGNLVLEFNVDNDSVVEMAILLKDLAGPLVTSDFVL